MLTIKRAIIILLLFSSHFILHAQQRDTINIDFGSDASLSIDGWNNLTNQTSGSIADLSSISGFNTGISIAITDPFHGVNTSGVVADAALEIPGTASGDSFFWECQFF